MSTRTLVLFGILIVAAVVGLTWLDGEPTSYTNETVKLSDGRSGRSVAAAGGGHDSTSAGPGVRPVGVMINSPTNTGDDPADDGNAFGVDLAFFGTFERTRLALELVYPQGGIIDLQNEESSLAVFEDDKGTDLRKKDQHFGPFEMMPRISENGHHLVFVVPSDQLPFGSASRLHARGEVAVLVADETDSFTAPEVRLRPETSFSLGGFDFEVTEAGKSSWGEGWSVTLACKQDLAPVVRWSVRTQDGRELELRPTMSMSGGGTWHQTLDVDEPVETVGFVLECWQDPRTVKVPFDVSSGLGLR